MEYLMLHGLEMFMALFAVSEGLSMLPFVKSNGVFQLVFNILKGIKDALKK